MYSALGLKFHFHGKWSKNQRDVETVGAHRAMNNSLNINVYIKASYVTNIILFSNTRVLTQKLLLTHECNATVRLRTFSWFWNGATRRRWTSGSAAWAGETGGSSRCCWTGIHCQTGKRKKMRMRLRFAAFTAPWWKNPSHVNRPALTHTLYCGVFWTEVP